MSPLYLILWVPTGVLAAFMALTDAVLLTKAGRKELLGEGRTEAIFWMHVILLILAATSLDIAGVRL